MKTYGTTPHQWAERQGKTFKEKLKPTPEQERALEAVLWRCRVLYKTALERRLTWWRPGQSRSVSRFQQEAELQEVRAAFPEYAATHSTSCPCLVYVLSMSCRVCWLASIGP